MRIKTILRSVFYALVLMIVLVLAIDNWISYKTSPYIYTNIDKLPPRPIGVVLGTAKYIRGGGVNEFYKQRILGAIELYHQDKIDYLLLSGDNALRSYNEPITMRKDLLKAGIPSSVIYLDYAGFRTLDSIIRANRVFDAREFTIITQQFHCERALFIAQFQGILAQCYAVPAPEKMTMVRVREMFARINTFIDLYLLNKAPKFLGPVIPIIQSSKEPEDHSLYPDLSQ